MNEISNGIRTSHELAKTLLSEPDSLLTIYIGEDEYMAEKIKTVRSYANRDDYVAHKAVVCKKMNGNLR